LKTRIHERFKALREAGELGIVAYITILFLLMYLDRARWIHFALVAVTGVGTILSARLLFYAHFVIRATCYWCVASAVAMAILFVLSICLWRTKRRLRAVPAFFYGVWRESRFLRLERCFG